MNPAIYAGRRAKLRELVSEGAILLLGNAEAPRNYAANAYPFRQDATFLYYTGLAVPQQALLILPDGHEILFGEPVTMDDVIWMGPQPAVHEYAETANIGDIGNLEWLKQTLDKLRAQNVTIHYLPPYRGERTLWLAKLLDYAPAHVAEGVSTALVQAVVKQRSLKSPEEIVEIENAIGATAAMMQVALQTIRPGVPESMVAGLMQGVALALGRQQAFLPIVSVRGEVLHNNYYGNVMQPGHLLLIDCGAESPRGYAGDITRTFPVSGQFTEPQREIYEVVLRAQQAVIDTASPRVTNRDLHFVAARAIAAGLKDLGLMRGDVDEAVQAGAHALFFPHGIGHMLGLDVHDMEDLGDAVGYAPGDERSPQFGLSFLRLARALEPGFVITDEPGVYFIPPLIDQWTTEKRHESFINYELLARYRDFGGIRIEDDLLITDTGARVLGTGIVKAVKDIEAAMKRG